MKIRFKRTFTADVDLDILMHFYELDERDIKTLSHKDALTMLSNISNSDFCDFAHKYKFDEEFEELRY